MRIERNNKKEYSTKLYKYLAIISITIITILVGMSTQPATTVSAQVTRNVFNITVEKVPIRLYYDSYRAANKDTYLSTLWYNAGTYESYVQNTVNGQYVHAIRQKGGAGLGWIRDDDRLHPRITVSFNRNGGNAPSYSSKQVVAGSQFGTMPTISRTGYSFYGWWTTSAVSGGSRLYANTIINRYQPRTHTIKSGDTWWGLATTYLGNGNLHPTLAAWSGVAANSTILLGQKITVEDPAKVVQNRTYYARWQIQNRTFYFNGNGGTSPSSIIKPYNSTVGTLPTSTRTGYNFAGWWTTSAASGGSRLYTTTRMTSNLTYYARWTAQNRTFYFNGNGGSNATAITKPYYSTVGTLPTSSRTGYTFVGWFVTSAATGGSQLTTSTLMTTTRTYYARWSIQNRTFSFNGNGGTSPASITKTYNSTVGTLPTSTRTGYNFAGWWTTSAASGGTQLATTTRMTSNLTYYARWTAQNRTFYFNGNGGSNATAITKAYNSTVGTLPTSSRTGYTFRGWWTTSAASGGTQLATSTRMTSNVTYYARWTINSYTFSFNGNGGSNATAITRTYNTNIGTLPSSTRSGYTFNGWYTSTSGGTKLTTTTKVTGSRTYYAQWTINRTVTFHRNGGNAPSQATKVVKSGTAIGTLPTISRTGHSFKGWYTSTSGGTKIATTTVISANVTYYAQWTANSYKFTFHANGGGTPSSASITRTYNTNIGTLPTISRTGYTFRGWWTTSAASGGTQLTTTTKVTTNVNYYARWTINSYKFTFNANGGGTPSSASITKTYNSTVGTLPTISRTGYTFRGWWTTSAASGGSQLATTTRMTANRTYYARWTINSYTATFNANGGTTPSPTTITKNYNTNIGTLPTTTRSGYYFNGWFTAASGGSKISTTTKVTSNRTYYAQWLVNRTVTFHRNGGNAPNMATKIVPNGHQIGTLATVSRTGHTFHGWWTTSATSGGTQLATTTRITSNITYYARWTANNYTVTFNANGGNTPSPTTITKAYGLQLGTLPTVSRSGYTFNGWYTATSGGSKVATTTIMTGTRTYYAQWTINRTVTFNSNGGGTPSFASRTLTSGKAFGSLPTVSRTGYTFAGWWTTSAASGGTQLATSTVITSNITYYARWSIQNRTFSFNGNGGSNATAITKTYNSTVGTLPTSTRTMYTFNGWFTATSGGSKLATTTRMTTNRTYYAQWTPNTYKVTYNANGGTGAPAVQNFVYNSGAKISTTKPTRTGYTFTHWLYSSTTFAPGQAIPSGWGSFTLTAQWKINNYTFSFNGNGGTNATAITKQYNSTVGTLPSSTRSGYTFRGWYTTSAATGGTQLTTTTRMTSNVTYYARWTINRTVTFNANGGGTPSVTSRVLMNGTAYGTPPTISRTGYTFRGWWTTSAASGGTELTSSTVITSNITYYARWTINSYKVTWNGNGGTTPSVTTKTYNSTVGTLPTSTRTGYTFAGWWTTSAASGGTKIATTTRVTNNVTYYARWTINKYTVNFNANGGNAVASKQYNYNSTLGTLPTTSRTGYTFNGWFTATSGGTKIATTTRVTNHITYYAQWKINSYTATFNGNGGSNGTSITKTYNSTLGTLPTSTRSGYYFNGWFTAASGGSKISTSTRITKNVTYYAQWLVNRTVTFNRNGGNAPSQATKIVPNGHQIGTLPTISRTGHTHTGWFTATSGGTKLATTTVITANITYYAQWNANNYTATFNANGGNTPSPTKITKLYNTAIGTLPTVTRSGHYFNGWFTATSGGTKISTTTRITANVTYYAQWLVNRTVTFNANGGNTPSFASKVVPNGHKMGTLPTVTRSGHDFNGWFTATSGGTKLATSTVITSNITYYAQWTRNEFNVIWNGNGGTTPTSRVVSYNSKVGTLPTTTRSGYTFLGWYTATTGGTRVTTSTVITKDVTFYAQWVINRTVTYNTHGGSTVASKTVTNGTVLTTLPTTTRTGYTFNGWYTAQTGGTKVVAPLTVTSNRALHAQWTINNYTVTFNSNGGSTVASKGYPYNTQLGTLPTPTRTGYTLKGWYTSATGGTKIATTTRVTNNVTYYAQWTINTYTATFNGNGGSNGTSISKVYKSQLGALPTSTRVGHTFNGWYTSRTGGTKVTTTTLLTTNVTYYAQWTAINYTVTFNSQSGSAVSSKVIAYGSNVGTLPTTTRSGYHFEGWFTSTNGAGSRVTTSTRIYGNTTYYAYWIINRTVTFNSNGGTTASPASKIIVHNRAIGTLPTTTRTGYTFDGWFTSRTGGTKLATTTLITSDITYYAQWTPITYTITWDAQGGVAVAAQRKAYDSRIGTLPTTTRNGYTFLGWYTGKNGTGSRVTTSTIVKGNATYYANWVINRTVTYNSHGGTAIPSKTVTNGTVIGELPVSTRTGYTFLGWYTAQTGGTKVTAPLTVTANMTLHAQWRINDYLVTYDANGGSAVTAEWHTYNTQIGTLPTTTRTGYTFQGWYTAKTGGTKISTQTIVTRNVTYYAQWVINVYNVTWNSNGGDSVPVSKVKYGHAIGTLPGPNRVGHTLNGWYTTRTGGTMISSTTKVWNHVTYYAQWTPVTYTVTFDSQGGSAVNAYRIVYNTTVGTLPTTTRTGYHFEGWFTSTNGGGSKVTTTTRIYGNTTYYAYWIINRTVTFNSNGGNAPSESTRVIVHGRALGELPTTTRTGYTLDGWFTSRTSGTQVTKDTLVTDNVTYYAQWTPLKYSVVFDAQGGSSVATKTLAHDSRLGTLPVTTRTGYHFEGWYTGKNGAGTQITERTIVKGPATYYAYWIINRTVLFDLNGGNTQSFNSKVIPHGKVVGTLPTATRVGHTFSGWYTGKTGGTKVEATTIVMSDITYYAQWKPITYTVRFDPLGGVGVPDKRVVYNTSVGELPHTARVGYIFRGWYTTQTGGTKVNERTRVMGDTTYYARWDDHANLTFNQNGGRSSLNTIRVPVGSSMTQVKDLIKAHTFNVGRLKHSSKVFKDILIEEPTTLNSALLIGNGSFNVTQDLVGTVQWSDEVLIDITTGPEVNNKDFTKFTHTNTQGITSSRTFVEGGKTVRQLRVNLAKAGTPIRLLGTNSALEMDVEGYNLNGFKHTTNTIYFDKGLNDTMDIGLWGTNAHIINTLDGKGSPRVAIEAMLSRIELIVKFDTQGGLPVEDRMVYYGDAIGTLPTATKEHYDFQGWYTEPLGKGVKLVTSKVFKTSETYYAHWTPKNYTIKFDSTGGTAVANRTIVYNHKLGELPTPTRVGYLLLGWYTQKNGMGTQVTTETIINGNFTYYAHWTDTVQLKFTGNGVALEPLNVKIGTTVKELRTMIYNRDEIVSNIKHDTQFFQNIEITEAGTGLKTNLVSGNDNMEITNHLTGKILWSPNVRYHLTTGPDVNNKPFDIFKLEVGSGKAVVEAPVQTYTTGQYAGKTLHYLTVDTRKTGVPVNNLGTLSKLNVDVEGYDITGWKNLVTGDTYNEPLTDVISVEQFRGAQAVRTRLNGDYTRVGIEAQLKRISYTVSFDSQGGANVPSQSIFHGAKLINIEVPTRTKYAFKGWFTQPNGKGEQLTLDTVIKSNKIYYAHWNEILNIKFETQGGSGPIAERNFEKGNTVGTLPLTTLTKHRFVGWFTQQDGKGERVTANRVPQSDETYFAYWREQMTVRFMDLQTEVDVQTVDVGTKLPSLPTVTREGHAFIGWLIDGTDSYLTKDTFIMGDMVVVAHFNRSITVKFDSQGGTAVADLNMLSGDVLPEIPSPTRPDYNFNGWYTQPGGYGASFRSGVPIYDDITLYAHWTDDEYRVTFDTMGGTPTTSILVIKGESIGLDGRTTREGYRFEGWYTEPGYINKVPSLYTPTKSVTLYAKWELIKIHEVRFNTNSDIILPSLYVTENTAIEQLPSPSRDGYGFLGWYLDDSLTVQVYEGYMPLQDTLLHAKWVKLAEIVNITFDSANGQPVRVYQAVKGQTLPSSYYQTPVRDGYRFMGWYVGNQLVSNSTVYQTHTNIVAKWEVRGSYDDGKRPSDPSLIPNLTPRPWVPTPYIEPSSKPVGEKTIEQIVTIDGVQVSEANDWLKAVTKVTLTTGREKQVIYGDE